MNTKGISPLIATVFLIAVAVALGSIVMSLGQKYVSGATTQAPGCGYFTYEIKLVKYTSATNELQATIKNGNTPVDGFKFSVLNSESTQFQTVDVQQPMGAFEIALYKVILDPSKITDVYEVELLPLRNGEICEESRVKVTSDTGIFKKD